MVPVNKKLLTGTVPVNKELLTGTVPVNKKLLTGTVPVNNLFLKYIHFGFLFLENWCKCLLDKKIAPIWKVLPSCCLTDYHI